MIDLGMKKLAAMGLCLAGLLAAVGCSNRPDDQKIVQSIQSQIEKDTAIMGEVTVESLLGSVRLNGHVTSEAARKLAEREAADTPGVTHVVNNLTVVPGQEEQAASAREVHKPSRRQVRERSEPAPRKPANEAIVALNSAPPDPAPVAAPAPAPTPVAAIPPPEPAKFTPFTPAAPAPPPAPTKYTIPEGTALSIRLIDAIDSSKNKPGDTFRATLNAPIRVDGDVAVPSGAEVEGRVADASNAGRFSGHSELKLELTKLTFRGNVYELQTADYDKSGNGRGKGTAEAVGGGAAVGAIIGAIAGGGRGAAIGTVAGAGAGGAARGAKGGQSIRFPSETVMSFRLQQPVTVAAGNGKDSADTRKPMAP